MKGMLDYGLPEEVVQTLKGQGITEPLPVQERTATRLLAGENLLVQSPTGSGKTLAYLLPVLARIDVAQRSTQTLVVVPTRELAAQVAQVLGAVKQTGLSHALLIGGANRNRQVDRLKRKPHVVVGTPGRIHEMIRDRKLRTDAVRAAVVDEADKLADERFAHDVSNLLRELPDDVQIMCFSATVVEDAKRLLSSLGRSFETLRMSDERINVDITHAFTMAEDAKKFQTLTRLVQTAGIRRAVVFITRNAGVEGLAGRLRDAGLTAQGIHSGLSSAERKMLIARFRNGTVDLLVTTDIFARGMDVPDVEWIVNYDLPKSVTDYVHRAGRTARAGRTGTVVSLVEERKKFVIRKFERELKIEIREKGFNREGDWIDVRY